MAKPRQKQLPTMEDREIKDLRVGALDYAEVRDERMELTEREHDLKVKLLTLMKKHKKKEYNCDGIKISVVAEQETVKVKIRKEKDED